MTDLIQLHLEAVERLQADLEERIRVALGTISAAEILARADELPQEIAEELTSWIDQYVLDKLVREAQRFLSDIEDEEEPVVVDEERVRGAILVLLDHFKATVVTTATAAFADIQNQAELQRRMGRSDAAILRELEDGKAGIGATLKGFENKLVTVSDSFISAAAGVVVLTSSTESLTWVTVRDKRVCVDCEPLHGQTRRPQEWIEHGLPRSGWSVCTGFCRCILVPASAFMKGGSPGPVVRERRR